jgi:hypothetical protein
VKQCRHDETEKAPDPEFDFLDFEEAERLLEAADEGSGGR